MKARKKRFAVVHPVGRKPFRDRPELTYRDSKELADQLAVYCRAKWPLPQRIQVDVHAAQILINGAHRASYSLHESREAAGRAAGFPAEELGIEA
ncbi:hypothetical protein HWD94_04130 [Pseudarthrobacter equi]|uniref:hypothetical protein n=1 Tax=Pseudarthrobacter equi TaxID=728066 RepID=UPI0021C1EB33|nr:hypothetical protein [Pseudarthrobacter equi]MCT9624312.1 hypothetical protein [Pseudarthrobacter equi]